MPHDARVDPIYDDVRVAAAFSSEATRTECRHHVRVTGVQLALTFASSFSMIVCEIASTSPTPSTVISRPRSL